MPKWPAVMLILAGGCGSSNQQFPAGPDGSSVLGDLTNAPGGDLTIPPGSDLATGPDLATGTMSGIKTVFMIVMENHNWSDIQGSASAKYINKMLLPMSSHAEHYFNPAGIHPSLPNYLWLEAGDNFTILDDNPPSVNSQPMNTPHLASLLRDARISWKTYQEDIGGRFCPLRSSYPYTTKHNPFVYFDDSTGGQSQMDQYCIDHNRPYTELATDLQSNKVARYNFITPNLCHDMHDSCTPANDPIQQGDDWLSTEVPKILASPAYTDGGVLFITWDESELGDFPIGMIVLSPQAKGGGYSNQIPYTHGSTLRTIEAIFGVTPLLGDAAMQTDLSDLFRTFP